MYGIGFFGYSLAPKVRCLLESRADPKLSAETLVQGFGVDARNSGLRVQGVERVQGLGFCQELGALRYFILSYPISSFADLSPQ